ncbi:hypothetical protein GCM10028895_47260 [Pontibacter rugosus]
MLHTAEGVWASLAALLLHPGLHPLKTLAVVVELLVVQGYFAPSGQAHVQAVLRDVYPQNER